MSSEHLVFLKSEGVIPLDSRVISTHNNLVIGSDSEEIVARISTVQTIKTRKDPGDLVYSHQMSNAINHTGAVLPPIDEEPVEFDGYIISRYPKMSVPDWNRVSSDELAETVHRLNTFPYQTISPALGSRIRRMDVTSYVQDRLDSLNDSINKESIAYVQKMLDIYHANHCFVTAAKQSNGLVHGDMHSGNVVLGNDGLLFIDLDSVAIGPREYDLASWCVRSMKGDVAPALEATTSSIERGLVNKDLIRSMVGWKVLSSMSHELAYGTTSPKEKIKELRIIAEELDAPEDWTLND